MTDLVADPGELPQTEGVEGRQLALNPYVRVIRSTDDEILVRHGTRSQYSEVISDAGRRHLLGRLLERFRRPASVEDLTTESFVSADDEPALKDAIAYLVERRVLVPAEDDWRAVYFDTFFGRAAGLTSRTIGVIGGGALARRLCNSLAPLGAEAIIALDDGAGRDGDLESAKVGGAAYPGEVEVRTESANDEAAIVRLYTECDVVVVAADAYSPRLFHLCNEAALTTVTPWLCTFFDGHEAIIGPTFVPGQTGCYAEFELQAEASLTQVNEGLLFKEAAGGEPAPPGPLLPPYIDVAGGFAVDATVRFLLVGSNYTVGRAMRIDFERASVDYQDVLTLPRCPACQATRGAYRHVFL